MSGMKQIANVNELRGECPKTTLDVDWKHCGLGCLMLLGLAAAAHFCAYTQTHPVLKG